MVKKNKVSVADKKKKLYNRIMDEKIRINKYLSDIGVCSRREADRLTEAGRVTANGELVSTGMKILPDAEICIDGKPVKKQEKKILLLFHKPKGIVCSTRQQRNEMTVTEYLDYPVRIYPIGRLDKDSEGLLLLTNEGDLVNRIMKAGNYHEKEYQVTVNKPVTEEFIRGMGGGVPILDTVTRPCKVTKTGKNSFRIILTQGLNRQIRRMCEAVGLDVIRLRRSALGAVKLGMLQPGQYRELTSQEVTALRTAASRGKTTATIAKNTAANAARRTAAGPHGPRAPKGAVAARKKRGGNRG